MTASPKVFINYRRDDTSGHAGRIYDRCVLDLGKGRVCMDVDTIPFGHDFVEYLERQVMECGYILAVIGRGWLEARNKEGKRRLDDPRDWVRIELAVALRRGIPVVPILVGGATMPKREDLPAELETLPRRQALVLTERGFHHEMGILIQQIGGSDAVRVASVEPSRARRELAPSEKSYATPWAGQIERDAHGLVATLRIAEKVPTRFRWVDPGRFLMGSPKSEAERRDDEGPQHWVTITRGFWMGETACTQSEWEAVMGRNPSRFKNEPQSAQRPVESVSWNDCQKFLKRVNAATPGLELRLPTEAEWEYACRAGTQTPFSFGENITTDQVSYDGNYPYAGAPKGQYRQKTIPVRSLPPNSWGLYEIHGNVWEWCGDWYGDYPAKEQRDPTGPTVGQNRVLRGGCWYFDAGGCRSARRGGLSPDGRRSFLGFRLLAVQPGEPE